MPPVATAERQTTTNNEEWGKERSTPELFKFEREGDEIIGFLRKCFREQAEGKEVPTYLIETDEHELKKVRSTFDLLQKLGTRDTGCRIRIRFDGEQATSQSAQGGSKMKKFTVWVKPGPRPNLQNNHEITDEDIPF